MIRASRERVLSFKMSCFRRPYTLHQALPSDALRTRSFAGEAPTQAGIGASATPRVGIIYHFGLSPNGIIRSLADAARAVKF